MFDFLLVGGSFVAGAVSAVVARPVYVKVRDALKWVARKINRVGDA